MRFYLSSDDAGRIILDTAKHGKKLRTLKAKAEVSGREIVRSAWQLARNKVNECQYRYEYGHGYFLKELPQIRDTN